MAAITEKDIQKKPKNFKPASKETVITWISESWRDFSKEIAKKGWNIYKEQSEEDEIEEGEFRLEDLEPDEENNSEEEEFDAYGMRDLMDHKIYMDDELIINISISK